MDFSSLFFSCVLMVASLFGSGQTQQSRNFITVDGADLRAKMEAAQKLGRAQSPQTRFWLAYSFDVRPGIAVDPGEAQFHGNMMTYDDLSVFIGKVNGVTVETRNLAVFLLYEPDGAVVSRLEVYNLDRPREYRGYPVYWLGRGGNEESLNLLRQIVSNDRSRKLTEHGIVAIALHDDPRVAGVLKNLVNSSLEQDARRTAVHWIGFTGGEMPFLTDLVRNESESVEMRETAAYAIGISKDAAALNILTELYRTIPNREIRRKLIFAISVNDNEEAATDFLIRIAKTDADTEARKQAMFWLGQKAGEKTLGVLKDAVDDPDTEVQKQAVFVLSRRPNDEAVPLLIKIARTHPKGEIRKEAIFWLGRTGDPRALTFFEELLSK
ncbi:MAG: HEAT repeat domain-containing protein [Acidobacteria bacterium]|nr:HEAT repeat domain-containing protein [Acidobacteriota bacterium]